MVSAGYDTPGYRLAVATALSERRLHGGVPEHYAMVMLILWPVIALLTKLWLLALIGGLVCWAAGAALTAADPDLLQIAPRSVRLPHYFERA